MAETLALALVVGLTACSSSDPTGSEGAATPTAAHPDAACALQQLTAGDGIHFGVNLDWGSQSVGEYADLLGAPPADVVSFSPIPWTAQEREWVTQAADQAAQVGAAHLLTLEPQAGLAAVTDDVIADVVSLLQEETDAGVPVIVRFAHEMNGSWYAWGQQPEEYVATFRRVAAAIHQQVPGAALMWAPNYGGGYPFDGGAYAAPPGSAAAGVLDTDGDGAVTGFDDPYAPYYPGDDYVDWVGMSLYHWGSAHPWGENEAPEAGKFVAQLTGAYSGLGGDDTAVPDFYADYGQARDKPVAIPETAALIVDRGDPVGQDAIRQAWWQQILAPEVHQRFPLLRLVNWFEWVKVEQEVGDTVHWAVLDDPDTREAFRADLPEWIEFGSDGCR
ncbi:hypothetical protein B5808_18095 [Cnuibacter physcomitrellae]|uniref:GH26 domain-containing protein n=1 Tax=Cnuibacter physcomitrellae TaxID=1619308 RepID=A0A1X9LP16_9MICO|nr:glycosyl hydrolase [Cnuibacter physcomitrellae]ARJ06923.1 hypothetical protein B5808_18095 [Cnuibacter physcomitrellae]